MAALSFPNNPTNGQVYLAPNGVRYQYSTSSKSWVNKITEASGLHGANPGSNPPTSPVAGTMWLDTDSKTLYVYLVSGSTGTWTAVSGAGGTTSDASGLALEGSATYDGNIVIPDVGINLEVQPAT